MKNWFWHFRVKGKTYRVSETLTFDKKTKPWIYTNSNVMVLPLPNPWSWKSSLTSPFFDTLKKRFDKLQLLAQPWCKIFGKRQPTNDNKYSSFIVIENSIFGSSIIYINVRTSSFETRVLSCLIIDNCHLILLQKTLINN